ncbi:hypothetical protein EMPG_17319 [Blastomyces silverae]|uniref:Uncharacterized protein n=1 Tax=Blastomyces silverae TaxID=2060906 RepID=A0A0H1BD68_9EURO|nr:hypothetical protein EMPG_17319 [Blastomyces silverae]
MRIGSRVLHPKYRLFLSVLPAAWMRLRKPSMRWLQKRSRLLRRPIRHLKKMRVAFLRRLRQSPRK